MEKGTEIKVERENKVISKEGWVEKKIGSGRKDGQKWIHERGEKRVRVNL